MFNNLRMSSSLRSTKSSSSSSTSIDPLLSWLIRGTLLLIMGTGALDAEKNDWEANKVCNKQRVRKVLYKLFRTEKATLLLIIIGGEATAVFHPSIFKRASS